MASMATEEEYFEGTGIPLTSTDDLSKEENNESIGLTFTEGFKIVVGIMGLLGNMTVCLAVIQMRSKEVKFLIGSQAAIDLLTSIVLLAGTFTSRYTFVQLVSPDSYFFGYIYCVFWHYDGLLFYLSTMSTYNLVAISVERYIAVLHPMWYRTNFSRNKAIVLGALLWLIAPTMQLVTCIGQTYYIDGRCRWIGFTPIVEAITGILLFIWDFFGPCIVMGYCFARIIFELMTQDERTKELQADNEVSTVSRVKEEGHKESGKAVTAAGTNRSRNVTKTFLLVFIAFVLCWVTNQVLYLQKNLDDHVIVSDHGGKQRAVHVYDIKGTLLHTFTTPPGGNLCPSRSMRCPR
ncbi:beta-2 adrenergic receptor-like [Amphiura filiformis]|uniref:beta-2 adrenergic receptor-like n=1 Tax=Amphiura filiformis TaxID=82378 RepID=UPI003B21A032